MVGRVNRRRDRWLKRALETLLRPFIRRPKLTLAQIAAERPRRVLIVRQHNQMGDMLCAVPAFRALRQSFPGARTLLVTAPVNDGVVRGNPYLDEILLFDKVAVRRSPRAALRFMRRLRAFAPDLAVVLNTVSFSGTSAWIAVLSGAPRVIGGESRPFGWTFSDWLYNLTLPLCADAGAHAIDHGLLPLAAAGIVTQDRSTLIVPDAPARELAHAFLRTVGERPRAAVHPGAGKERNRWPPERFAAAIAALQQAGSRVYLIEGPADGQATAQTLSALGRPLPVLRDAAVPVVAAALAETDFALVNDTGIMHVAGAVGTATVALFGPTLASVWKPPSSAVAAVQSRDGTMEGISIAEVLDALRATGACGAAAPAGQTKPPGLSLPSAAEPVSPRP
jgi:ADP-heptose:LPS heptosyltransferase